MVVPWIFRWEAFGSVHPNLDHQRRCCVKRLPNSTEITGRKTHGAGNTPEEATEHQDFAAKPRFFFGRFLEKKVPRQVYGSMRLLLSST